MQEHPLAYVVVPTQVRTPHPARVVAVRKTPLDPLPEPAAHSPPIGIYCITLRARTCPVAPPMIGLADGRAQNVVRQQRRVAVIALARNQFADRGVTGPAFAGA